MRELLGAMEMSHDANTTPNLLTSLKCTLIMGEFFGI